MAKHRRVPAPSPARLRVATASAAAAALTGGLFVASTGSATAATPGVAASDADFNGDGAADVAVSAPGAYVGGQAQAGLISVLYGGGRHATISQNSAGVPGSAENGDHFGADTAYGDFNGDGYDDLAVGASSEDVGTDKDGGTVVLLWGSANGLQGGTTVKDPRPTKHDNFGVLLEAADLDGDGKDDLVAATGNSATVDIVRGGFTAAGGTGGAYTLVAPLSAGPKASGDAYGVRFLQSGDTNGDGIDDLLVNGWGTYAGSANYWFPGTPTGLKSNSWQDLPDGVVTDIGDINEDGYGDIVFGQDADGSGSSGHKGGAVLINYGSSVGPSSNGVHAIHQDTAGVPGSGEAGDGFGYELDLGDVNGDGHLDLVVGAPGEDLTGKGTNDGSVTVLYGAADGSGINNGAGAQFYSQNTPGVPNTDEKNDNFGNDVHIDDLDGDGRGDVVVGASGENGGNGAVYALHSNPDGTLSASAGIYTSTLGISASGTPKLGVNYAD
ncbi:FG-GAP repeat protein [Streptomyces longispororuber]|uniref:FG-GAP repeat protein n=1 Tax=Streptomyces longispororuber TaxID=68230 RepID=UPI00210B8A89|nr:FG-GAP repeat protein [Streptomyces longispororuber]MCQ4207814.1 FG-GAP repeat protein [Streptomyces longispororuber]